MLLSKSTSLVKPLLSNTLRRNGAPHLFLDHCRTYNTVTSSDERNAPDVYLKGFLSKTYLTTGSGIVGYLAAAQFLGPLLSPTMCLGVGFVGSIGSSMAISTSQPMYVRNEDGIVAQNSLARQVAFGTLLTSFGIMSSPVIGFIMQHNPSIVGAALLASTSTMAGASAYALTTPRNITAFGGALTGGLFGLIAVSLGGLGADMMGYHSLAHSLHSFTSYGSVLVFTGLTAYDTQIALQMAKQGQPDHLGVSAQLFMNFANLFQSFMTIFYNSDR